MRLLEYQQVYVLQSTYPYAKLDMFYLVFESNDFTVY